MKTILIALCILLPLPAAEQPAFEVASVRAANPSVPIKSRARVGPQNVDFVNIPLFECVRRAWVLEPYQMLPYQLIAPKWIKTARYTITAKAAGPAPQREILLMLQNLLAERFRLVVHHEARPMPVYALTVGKNGPRLKEATDEGDTDIGPSSDSRETEYRRATMQQLAIRINRFMDRPVIDATGLKGRYNFKLAQENLIRPGSPDAPDPADLMHDIFTDIQDRLGLKLEAKKAPIDVLVIDHIEKPSEN